MAGETKSKADEFFETLWVDNEFRDYVANNNIPLEFIFGLIDRLLELTNKENAELKADKEWLDNTDNQQIEVILELQKQIEQLSNDNHVLKTAFITQKEQIEYLNSEILQMRCPGNCNNANSEKCSSSCYNCEYYEYND